MTRYSLQIPNLTFPGVSSDTLFERVASFATAADRTGFSAVYVMDHFLQLPMLGGPTREMLEAYTLLGALAARTERVKLGALVTGVTYRNPALLAKEATTLDVISRGRAILGLGAAWYDVEHTALGVPFPDTKERMDRLEEALQICRLMFTETAPSFEGTYYSIKEAPNEPRPVQPRIPIMVGGSGPKRTLRAAARYADMSNVGGAPEVAARAFDTLAKHCADIGRDPSTIAKTTLNSMFLTDTAEAGAALREQLTEVAGERVRSMFVGSPDSIASQVQAYVDIGVDEIIVNMPGAHHAEQIEQAGEVMSAVLGA